MSVYPYKIAIKKVYISGPMSNKVDFNKPAFNKAARQLRSEGFEVVNPAETDGGSTHKPWSYYMKKDIEFLPPCDLLMLLPGWEDSLGAATEIFIATILQIPIFLYENREELQETFFTSVKRLAQLGEKHET